HPNREGRYLTAIHCSVVGPAQYIYTSELPLSFHYYAESHVISIFLRHHALICLICGEVGLIKFPPSPSIKFLLLDIYSVEFPGHGIINSPICIKGITVFRPQKVCCHVGHPTWSG